ncbi:olfactory receptor 5AR1-like [Pleurodeles waltl]|uniref:olfactory receptor 5AR1-like n=1 Tax=Pleurodeles waltl TaxID=8319 RepID=UPI0037097D21
MEQGNLTRVKEFILLGLTDIPELKTPLFWLFLVVFIITLLGNLSIIALVWFSPHLHTPMYILLGNLSVLDLCYCCVITPNMLANFLSKRQIISLSGCAAQMFIFVMLGSTEDFLLAVMAYDRYAAICHPLHYSSIITNRVCIYLVVGSYLGGLGNSVVQTTFTFMSTFCGPNQISHFLCDIPPLLNLSCSDTTPNEVALFIVAGAMVFGCLTLILVSYVRIIVTILMIRSSEGRRRTFSTCSSHFICVTLFFGTVLFMYFRPSSKYALDQDRVASLCYTVIIPMLNPLIYSLRNHQVKKTMLHHLRNTCVLK